MSERIQLSRKKNYTRNIRSDSRVKDWQKRREKNYWKATSEKRLGPRQHRKKHVESD
jgi:hypothetical protein